AQGGNACLAFLGVPVGMGLRLGRDANMDGVPDGDPPDTPETAPPVISSQNVAWKSSRVARVRWHTDQFATSSIQVFRDSDGTAVDAALVDERFKKDHTMVARGMHPNESYTFKINGTNRGGIPAAEVVIANVLMTPDHLFQSTHSSSVTLSVVPG